MGPQLKIATLAEGISTSVSSPREMSESKPKLHCAWFCPFAHRAWISMLAKGVDFEYIEQNPYDKSAEWLAVNPRGLIPVIVHNGNSIYESHVCIEYIDEAWPSGPSLLPKGPYQRARARMWGDFIVKKIIPPYYRFLVKQSPEIQKEAKEQFLANLLEFTQAMDQAGPFFQGKELGYVDIMFAPWACRMYILEHYRGFVIPQTEELKRYHIWAEAVKNHPSVKAVLQDKDRVLANAKPYAEGNAKSELADAVRKGTTIP
ncbi:hypothetical protein ACROYT_G037383 [Oculina patagonica]